MKISSKKLLYFPPVYIYICVATQHASRDWITDEILFLFEFQKKWGKKYMKRNYFFFSHNIRIHIVAIVVN